MDLDECCLSTDVGTWTNLLTFEPDLDHSPDAGTGFLSHIAYALQQWNFITSGKSHARTGIGGPSKQQRVVLRHRKTVVRGKCALPSALLVSDTTAGCWEQLLHIPPIKTTSATLCSAMPNNAGKARKSQHGQQ